jgi:hypothetical protein
MVAIPDVSGLSLTAAQELITSYGLRLGSAYSIGNSRGASSANNNLAAGARLQTYICDSNAINCNNHGLLVDYETTIDLDSYIYVAPTTTTTTTTPAPNTGGVTPAPDPGGGTPAPPSWYWLPCETYQVTYPQCQGEDVYNAIWEGTRRKRSDADIYEVCTSPTWTGVWGGCIATNNSGCGGSGGAGTSPCAAAPAPTITYGPCQNAGIIEVDSGCVGTQLRVLSYRYRHAPVYSNGVATGTYDDAVCTDTLLDTNYIQIDGICGYQATTATEGTTASTASTAAATKWCSSLGEYIGINDYCPSGGGVVTTEATTEATVATTEATVATTASTAACSSNLNTYAGCVCNGGIWRSAGCMI